jgi:drug/metabolite transporter (DMT)-like permease
LVTTAPFLRIETEPRPCAADLLLPAMLYFASNVTAMHALSHLRSYIFTAIMNSRIVFAALLSVALLRKSINAEQWQAITIICCAAIELCL